MSQQFERNIFFGFIITLAVVGSSFSDLAIKVVLEQPLKTPSPDVVATSLILSFTPGDEGSLPHHHAGPVVGYVLEGQFLFQARHATDSDIIYVIIYTLNITFL